jgi:hypothetical protein
LELSFRLNLKWGEVEGRILGMHEKEGEKPYSVDIKVLLLIGLDSLKIQKQVALSCIYINLPTGYG